MKIFDHVEREATHQRRYDGIQPMQVNLTSEVTGRVRDFTTDINEEHLLTLTLQQSYWANRAQERMARDIALRMLSSALYEDVLREIDHARLCIVGGDKVGALAALDRMQEATKP